MSNVELNVQAPVFALPDYKGNHVSLDDFIKRKNVLLVLNRGFF
jgi:peroxiredoxin